MAAGMFRSERRENVLQPTGVVNELFLKLIRQRSLRFEDRQHFYSVSARLMRRVLVDHARARTSQKRDGGLPVPLDESLAWVDARGAHLFDLDRVLNELHEKDAQKCRLVELRFFLGFTVEETAELLDISKAMYERLHAPARR
jgi:RNA polymerase sigma factor (TIGR02999 family)